MHANMVNLTTVPALTRTSRVLFCAAEIAETYHEKHVTLVQSAKVLVPGYGARFSRLILQILKGLHVEARQHTYWPDLKCNLFCSPPTTLSGNYHESSPWHAGSLSDSCHLLFSGLAVSENSRGSKQKRSAGKNQKQRKDRKTSNHFAFDRPKMRWCSVKTVLWCRYT